MTAEALDVGLRRTVVVVALLNLGYFGIEFVVALAIGSVSLFADSIDFLEDASVNLLIAFALGWPPKAQSQLGMALALILLVPALATLWTAWQKFSVPVAPSPVPLTAALRGANRQSFLRLHAGPLPPSQRQPDQGRVFVGAQRRTRKCAIIAAGLVTAALWRSAWPDLVVGLGIAVINADAAREVWHAARGEHRAAADAEP